MVPATEAHARELALTLREADAAECWAAGKMLPLEALMLWGPASRDTTYTGLADGKVLCMYGFAQASVLSPMVGAWLLASRDIEKHARAFLRMSRAALRASFTRYDVLCNLVDARNVVAVRWLRWLGAEFYPAIEHGPYHLPFYPFAFRSA